MVALASLLAWVYLVFAHGRFWRIGRLLERVPAAGGESIAVVIPARDEAATIGDAVQSLVAQGLPVWVVDDHSSDGTGEIAAQAGATVVRAAPLPAGWSGKVWAMHCGVEHALAGLPDYVLFTDADIVHAPGDVRQLAARGADLASVMVRLHCSTLAERLLVPAFVYFFFMLYPPAWGRGAAGGCILLRREMLERIGGLRSIAGELIDDCALAGRVRAAGGSVWLGMSEETRSVRLYPGFADIRRMIRRTAFTQLRYSSVLLVGTIAGMAFLYVVPVMSALSGTAWGMLAWLLMAGSYVPMARFYRQPVWSTLVLPAVALFYLAATLESAVRYWMRIGGTWKGRHQAHGI